MTTRHLAPVAAGVLWMLAACGGETPRRHAAPPVEARTDEPPPAPPPSPLREILYWSESGLVRRDERGLPASVEITRPSGRTRMIGRGATTPIASPDLRWVAWDDPSRDDAAVVVADTTGREPSQVTHLGATYLTAWSPSSELLLFYDREREAFFVWRRGREPVRIAVEGGFYRTFSADSRSIFFTRLVDGSDVVVRVGSDDGRVLTERPAGHPFERFPGCGGWLPFFENDRLWIASMEDDVAPVAVGEPTSNIYAFSGVRWSTDCSHLAWFERPNMLITSRRGGPLLRVEVDEELHFVGPSAFVFRAPDGRMLHQRGSDPPTPIDDAVRAVEVGQYAP